MELFSKKKGLGNQFREVSQLEIVKLIIYRPHFHRKSCAFKRNTENFGKFRNTKDVHFAKMLRLLIEYS
jgi:hypothetical protein